MRTKDTEYGQEYWDSLDGGLGYQDSTMWEDIAHTIKEVFAIDHENCDIAGSISLVDVGCAHGFLVRHLRRRGFDAWGLDISQYALDHAAEDAKAYLRIYDLSSTNESFFGRYRFDMVTCFETLEHIVEGQAEVALWNLGEMLKPGGTAVLAICTDDRTGWDTDPTHVNIKPRSYWSTKLQEVGFHLNQKLVDRLWDFHLFRGHNGIFVAQKV